MTAKKVPVNNMNFKANEDEKKLKGSYYTPDWLAGFVARWIKYYSVCSVLEPSCGDGVFFDAVIRESSVKKLELLGFDIDSCALDTCRRTSFVSNATLSLHHQDFLAWAIDNIQSKSPQKFDAVVGNPPFVRYQYL